MVQPGCAAVFASVNGLHLEAPSQAQKAEARSTEVQHLTVALHELKVCILVMSTKCANYSHHLSTGCTWRRRRMRAPPRHSI